MNSVEWFNATATLSQTATVSTLENKTRQPLRALAAISHVLYVTQNQLYIPKAKKRLWCFRFCVFVPLGMSVASRYCVHREVYDDGCEVVFVFCDIVSPAGLRICDFWISDRVV